LENAVTHGALKRGAPGLVRLTASRKLREDTPILVCTIEDDGPGFAPAVTRAGGIGLPAARRRLALWSRDARIDIHTSADGTRVVVELPWKT
jgi:LytS/YehU family sensor histidine kinase